MANGLCAHCSTPALSGQGYCREHRNRIAREWYRRQDPEHSRLQRLRRPSRGGLPIQPGDYERLLGEQGGGCAICGLPEAENRNGRLHFDHDHAARMVRGLLCNRCNTALGLMKDSPNRLREAAVYLERAVERKEFS